MNNKYSIITICAALVLFFTSCADDELQPILTFDQLGKGGYVRLISESDRELDLANLGSAQYTYTVEFIDLEGGTLVSQYDINVQFIDNNPDNGDDSAGPLLLKSLTSGDFSPSSNGNVGVENVTIALNELLSLFGLSADNLIANDRFRILGSITLQDGSVFDFDNSSPAVNGSAFAGHFRFDLTATCPLPDDIFVGSYALEYLQAEFPFGVATFGLEPTVVNIGTVSGSTTKRSFSFTYLEEGGFGNSGQTFEMEFLCDKVIASPGQDLGLRCVGDNITAGTAPNASSVDINDDSVFEVTFLEFETDGGCGVAPLEQIIRLTKQ